MPGKQRVDLDEVLLGDILAAKSKELEIVAVLSEAIAQEGVAFGRLL